jgi:hypothetical protein
LRLVCRIGNAHKTDGRRRRAWGCNRPWIETICRSYSGGRVFRVIAITTTNKSPSQSVTYKGYNDCILGPRASRRFPLWMLHPPDEKLVRKSVSSSCPSEMSDLVSFGICRTSWSTIVEPPGRLSSTVPMPMTAQCCEFPTLTGSRLRAVYDWNCVRNGVTW